MIQTIVVDDEVLSRIGIQSFLDGKEDIEVAGVFPGAEEALAFLRENNVDVVLTDIEMADMNGLEFIACIRREHLAQGIIILSAHEDFRYAQEAIEKGTNSYLLKMDISEEKLVQEVRKVYEQTKTDGESHRAPLKKQEPMKEGIHMVGLLWMTNQENKSEPHQRGAMLVHLLEDLVGRYQMGTLFSPYNKELFIIFYFESSSTHADREKDLAENIRVLHENLEQYVDDQIVFGISSEFTDLTEMRNRYEGALAAAELSFYGFSRTTYREEEVSRQVPAFVFSTDKWNTDEDLSVFAAELEQLLLDARRKRMDVTLFKEQLIQSLNWMVYQIIQENRVRQEFIDEWNQNSRLISLITGSVNMDYMKENIMDWIGKFRMAVHNELAADEFAEIMRYIEQHLRDKIVLADLAEVGCMSTATMCRKFKERSGTTIVQYINERRIERAKQLMNNKNYTLAQIADEVGFSNENYLIRVFKKVTGITVGDYRRNLNI